MPLGPIELLVVKFPGSRPRGDIMPAMAELVENGTVHIVDLLLVSKDDRGDVTVLEFSELDPDTFGRFAPLMTETTPLLNEGDAYQLAGLLENDTSAGLVLFENTWATRFAEAIRAAQGEVVFNERIPRAVIEEVAAALG